MNNRDKFINSPVLQVQEKILKQLFNADDKLVLFDIGACEGESSIRYAKLFPDSIVYTFEPLTTNFELVKKNIEAFRRHNVRPFQLCLSDKEGELTFYVSEGAPEGANTEDWDYGNKSSSLLPPEKTVELINWLQFKNEIKVKATTLKAFCSSVQLKHIDFIHMDVQGAELLVLEGAGDFIKNINAMWLEVAKVELYKGQALKHDVEQFMEQHGFVKIADTVYTYDGDQFWVNKNFIKDRNLWWVIQAIRLQSFFRKIYKTFRRRFLNKYLIKNI
ncbi:MAG: FkbM family methyltransferase [Bacteroidia bacterium]|nr:MAG: FkbM family methyltransferase [Bacteroidia bacterium]